MDEYHISSYKEARLRADFIDEFFKALGWDMSNKEGRGEVYREVVYEDTVKVDNKPKAPDYSFRVGNARKFFVEAKQPSTNLQVSRSSAFQLRRYAWSANLPLSILTNFKEFAVYDGRVEPKESDDTYVSRVIYFKYDEYDKQWEKIAGIFSREAAFSGAYDDFVWNLKPQRGSRKVDTAFLKEIESWREILANNIALRNQLTTHELNDAVQLTIDRLIFLRMSEDRGIENYGRLQQVLKSPNIYAQLSEIFQYADQHYNSGLFHFEQDKTRSSNIDSWTLNLSIDDKPLERIISHLYYPNSPYEFSVMPADILGQVYEQFLGKVIRQTPSGGAIVEEKPEVKKAGGVYYTPTFIVDYIIEHTIGKLCDNMTPEQVKHLRIIDPSCGSGTFLISAYQYLLDWHLQWYLKHSAKKHAKNIYQGLGDVWHLTANEKKRILLQNIYGVDIDAQAVEVTKLSLLLKVLEGESEQSISDNLRLFHERALPDLAGNIRWGNTLIGQDYYNNPEANLLDEESRYRINAFDWNEEFTEIMEAGGFDAVIGNPPYIGFHAFKEDKEYLKKSFISATGKFDYYLPFIEKGMNLLKDNGVLGFICPTNFMKRGHGQALRNHLKVSVKILEVCDFEDVQIFSSALNYTGIFILEKAVPSNEHNVLYKQRSIKDSGFYVQQKRLGEEAWIFRKEATGKIVEKVKERKVSSLKEITSGISEGIVTGHNDVFLLPRAKAEELGLEPEILRPCLRGRQIRRYWVDSYSEVVIYPYRLINGKTRVIAEEELARFSNVWAYLSSRRAELGGRSYFEASTKNWYELWCQRDLKLLAAPKIVVPELSDSNRFALTDSSLFYGDTVCGITVLPDTDEDLAFILGILNSKLIEFYYKQTTVPKANKFYIYKTMFLKHLPIRRIDFSNQEEKNLHDRMTILVGQILSLHTQVADAKTSTDKIITQRQLDAVDHQIDKLVYELYDLTDEEIEIIEGSGIARQASLTG
jgi:type I restriction-modification system DNA methylase subunit